MPSILIQAFAGVLPAVAAHLLNTSQAQTAKNCDLRFGDLRPLKSGQVLAAADAGAATLFRLPGGGWVTLGYDADMVVGPVVAADKRIYWTRGDGAVYPKKSSVATWPTAKRMGVPAPTAVLTVTLVGAADPNAQVFQRSWCYTVTTSWGEESAPSPVTAVTAVSIGQTPRLTGFAVPDGFDQTDATFRIYETSTGTTGSTDFLFVDEIDTDLSTYDDTKLPGDLVETIQTEYFTAPADDLRGLILAHGGMLAAFRANEVYISEPNEPTAWPNTQDVSFRKLLDHDVVALGSAGNVIIAATKAAPYAIYGTEPESLQSQKLNIKQACRSKRGLVSTESSVIYPSHDGLVSLPTQGEPVITRDVIDTVTWKALGPQNLIATWLKGEYLGFFAGTATGIIFDTNNPGRGLTTLDWGYTALSAYYDAENDILGVLVDDAGTRRIVGWQDGGADLTYLWKSKVFVTQPVNLGVARIMGRYAGGKTVTFRLYADGVLKHTEVVSSNVIFPLPGGYEAQKWEISLEGAAPVEEVSVAVASEEIGMLVE